MQVESCGVGGGAEWYTVHCESDISECSSYFSGLIPRIDDDIITLVAPLTPGCLYIATVESVNTAASSNSTGTILIGMYSCDVNVMYVTHNLIQSHLSPQYYDS